MKKGILWMMAVLLCCLTVTSLGSCTNDNADNGGYGGGGDFSYNLNNVEIVDSGVINTVDLIKDVIDDHSMLEDCDDSIYTDWGRSQFAIIDSQNKAGTRAGAGEGWDGSGGTGYAQCAKWVTIRYKSTSVDGSTKYLSELIVWPYNRIRRNPNPKNLVIGCHCTITSNAERPTNFSKLGFRTDISMLALLFAARRDCLVVIPDYEGYGATHGDPHPYCNRDVTAKQVLDGASAAVAWYEKNEKPMAENWRAFAVGYSQGGAVAAGTLRYYLNNSDYKGFTMAGAVCGDGPYDPLATLKTYIETDRLYMPVAPALLLKGAVDTNKELKALGCTYRDFVTDDFYNTGIFDWLQRKDLTTDDIQAELLKISKANKDGFKMVCWSKTDKQFMVYSPENAKGRKWDLSNGNAMNYCTVDQCLKPGVIAYFKDGSIQGDVPEAKLKALEQALKENSLYYGNYVPDVSYGNNGRGRFTLFHSTRDEVVPVSNLLSVKDKWGSDVFRCMQYESGTYLHVGTGASYYAEYVGSLFDEFFNDKWKVGYWKITGKFY